MTMQHADTAHEARAAIAWQLRMIASHAASNDDLVDVANIVLDALVLVRRANDGGDMQAPITARERFDAMPHRTR